MTEDGQQVLRFIVDLRSTNFFVRQIQGDTHTLTGAASFQRIIVARGCLDVKDAFLQVPQES